MSSRASEAAAAAEAEGLRERLRGRLVELAHWARNALDTLPTPSPSVPSLPAITARKVLSQLSLMGSFLNGWMC